MFFYDYEDMQFYGGLFDSPVGVLFGITNVVDGVATGSELPNAPELTFSSMVRYEWPITGALTADVAFGADFQPQPARGARGQLLAL